jgi:hypothetical protein
MKRAGPMMKGYAELLGLEKVAKMWTLRFVVDYS